MVQDWTLLFNGKGYGFACFGHFLFYDSSPGEGAVLPTDDHLHLNQNDFELKYVQSKPGLQVKGQTRFMQECVKFPTI